MKSLSNRLSYQRSVQAAGFPLDDLFTQVTKELPELMERWGIENFDSTAQAAPLTIQLRSDRFNGGFEFSEGYFCLKGRLSWRAAFLRGSLDREFDAWLAQLFGATPDL